MRALPCLAVSLCFVSFGAIGCDSDRSTGGGGVRQTGATDTGVARPMDAGDASTGSDVIIGGGGSGVSTAKFLDELTETEIQTVCQWNEQEQGGAGSYTCSNEVTVNVPSAAECVADSSMRPHCTVGQMETCISSLMGDPCAIFASAACAAYIQCATSQPPPTDAGE